VVEEVENLNQKLESSLTEFHKKGDSDKRYEIYIGMTEHSLPKK